MEIGSKRAELGIRDMVGWQNGRNAILTGTGKRMVPNTGPEEERRKEVVKACNEEKSFIHPTLFGP